VKSNVAVWSVLVLLALATIGAAPFITPLATAIAISLVLIATIGTLRHATWGITAAQTLSWLALLGSFAFAVPDPESRPDSVPLVQAILGRPAGLFELSVGVAVAVAPWLLCLHILGLQKRTRISAAHKA